MTQLRGPTPAREDLVAAARDFTERELLPRAPALDATERRVIADVWRHLVELGLDRALLADNLGGVGLDVADFLCVLEEVAYGDAGVALAVLLNNAAVVSLPAEAVGDLPDGDRWTLAFTPRADEPAGECVTLGRDGGSAHVTGRLAAVFGAVDAQGIVVAAGVPEPTVFAIQAGTPGLRVRADPLQMGLRFARCADLDLTGVEPSMGSVPGSAAVESRARTLVRCGVAAISHGIARRARDVALAYAHTRIQGGKPIVEHGAVSDMLAGMTIRLHSGAADQVAAAVDDPTTALCCKIAASDAAMRTAIDAVQVMGGTGYMVDTGVEKLMRDAKYCQLYPERNWLARDELLRQYRPSSGWHGHT
jgi:alkylation response protein AidB-like acyl-CoA dehydrogenase